MARRTFCHTGEGTGTTSELEFVYGHATILVCLPGDCLVPRVQEFLSRLPQSDIVAVNDHWHWNRTIVVYYRREWMATDGEKPEEKKSEVAKEKAGKSETRSAAEAVDPGSNPHGI